MSNSPVTNFSVFPSRNKTLMTSNSLTKPNRYFIVAHIISPCPCKQLLWSNDFDIIDLWFLSLFTSKLLVNHVGSVFKISKIRTILTTSTATILSAPSKISQLHYCNTHLSSSHSYILPTLVPQLMNSKALRTALLNTG